mmetsp:Transcript_87929/g.232722  ORF Transcript_87929/g.232722 Transcript_87929/m.232722 type:complete len:370 (+) Transcript_87929:1323-2432(+)
MILQYVGYHVDVKAVLFQQRLGRCLPLGVWDLTCPLPRPVHPHVDRTIIRLVFENELVPIGVVTWRLQRELVSKSILAAEDVVLLVQPIDQFLSSRLDAVVRAASPHVMSRAVVVRCHDTWSAVPRPGLTRARAAAAARAEPVMSHRLVRGQPRSLRLLQDLPDEVLAGPSDPPRHPQLLRADVGLAHEGEASAHEAVHDDAHRPHVHLQAVVPVEKLGCPEYLGADGGAQPLVGGHTRGGAEVCEHDFALRVHQILSVSEVVVTLDIAVDGQLHVQILNAGSHLPRHVHDVVAIHRAPLLQLPLQALHEIAATVLVHYNANEAPLIVNTMDPDNVLVIQAFQQSCLLSDLIHGRLNLVDHLHRVLEPS